MKYITTPIYYVNDKPHLGHAYTTMAADIASLYWQKRGEEIFLLTGTDEHGQKVAETAEEKDISIKKFVDDNSKKFQNAWKSLNIKNNFFIRTTDKGHIKYVKDFLTDLYRKEEIYKGVYEGLYCSGCEAYLSQSDLKGNLCPIHKTPPEKIKEEVYFFKLSQYQRKLVEAIEDEEMIIKPESRKNEVISFLTNNRLEDVAITRSKVDWGIKVPWDKKQTVYVWVDALINYLSSLRINDKENLWPADIHFMAKDILRFHGVIWPALLMAANKKLPKKVFAHGFFMVDGEKMSKSLGNMVDPVKLVDKYPTEALRYYLFRSFPFGQDGDFKEKEMVKVYNAQLANDLGNLVQRTLTMINKYEVKVDKNFYQFKKDNDYEKAMMRLDFYEALKIVHSYIKDLNKLIESEKPWQLYKKAKAAEDFDLDTEKRTKFDKIFKKLLSGLSLISYNLYPFLPEKSLQIDQQLKDLKPEPIFPKIEN